MSNFTKDQVEKNLRTIVADQCGLDESDIQLGSTFENSFGCDSLDRVEILMGCEEEFLIEIDDEEIEKVVTFNDAVNYICCKLSGINGKDWASHEHWFQNGREVTDSKKVLGRT